MNYSFQKSLLLSLVLALAAHLSFAKETIIPETQTQVQSPDGNLVMNFYQKRDDANKKRMYYTVAFKGKPVVLESVLDIQIDNRIMESAMAVKADRRERWTENLDVKEITKSSEDQTWKPVYGEKSQIRDHYNEATVKLAKDDAPNYRMHMVLRAYNEGVAFQYFFPEHPQGIYYRIASEDNEFTMPEGTKGYVTTWAQGPYQLLPLQNWPDLSERPLTLTLPNGLYVSLAEAQMVDYVMTKFKLRPDKLNTVMTSLYESVDMISPFSTPWRVIMVAEKPGKLLENNHLILNLNEPNKIVNTSWIKPGKLIREITLTDENAKACIDFAAAHNLQYIMFDWKWYGPAFSFASDARKVVVPLDVKKWIAYGKEKNVGVILYVNQQALLKQADEIFPLYKQWGVAGVKFGFVQTGAHRWTTWMHDAIKKAAEHQLMVNVHDEYRPTGFERTYPNLMTMEGIRGNEEFPDATHNTILPFTRYIAGAGDYTICYYDKRLKTTHAHQLALNVISYSPLQSVFWYDKPSDYQGEPEIEFFEKMPTVWDETKVIQGEIGQYITMARRSGNDWFVGTLTNNDARTLTIPLDFLPKGKKYIAKIYSDDPTVNTRTKVRVEQQNVTSTKKLNVKFQPSGGQAIWLTPAQ
ncbi:glycoside hydrolase family 97 protein [Botryobacter ruber]|uniref:glycoside hydrolase family 97 protein n=1 Tax=Botryobacter ruber TaxID=2171629 RepID=UPI000E0BB952|nr:glycoside hydrolase family 97 protein [Botryobacter ruber]